jgi:hypothetical protein
MPPRHYITTTQGYATVIFISSMATDYMQGPGVILIRSKISLKSQRFLEEPIFLDWWDTENMPKIVKTSGIHSAFRYLDVTEPLLHYGGPTPTSILAIYALDHLSFTEEDEYKEMDFEGDDLPWSGDMLDLANLHCCKLCDPKVIRYRDDLKDEGAGEHYW